MADQKPSTPDQPEENGRVTIARLAEQMLPKLIERLTASELGELEVREDGWRIRLRKPTAPNGSNGAAQAQATRGGAAPRQRSDGGTSGARSASAESRSRSAGRPAPDRGLVTSPGVGYFVARESVAVGAALRNGDVVGHVDVLGVRQVVVSPIDGVLRSIDVQPGQAVEYGQPIARIESKVQAHVQ